MNRAAAIESQVIPTTQDVPGWTLSTALKATYKVFSPKHLPDYLGAFCLTTNHRRNMRGMIGALCSATASACRLTRRTVYA